MINSYLKIAWRNITRHKLSSFIYITGLAIGIASVIFIMFYVQDEKSYDRFLQEADRIYAVNIEGNAGGQEYLNGTTPPPAGAALANNIPEIETYTRMFNASDQLVRTEGKDGAQQFFTESDVRGVDSNFLQVFRYPLKSGDAATCLMNPDDIVITESISKKYFGDADAVGRLLLFGDDRKPFTVTAVLEDLPPQSSLRFDMLRPISSYPAVKRFSWSWVWMQMTTFVKLRENVSREPAAIAKLESKFPAMLRVQAAKGFQRLGMSLDALDGKDGKYLLHLQPLTSVHLHSAGISSAITTLSDIKYVYIFSVVAFLIIILACVNFMNLSTAQSARRAKEVGVRKVLGSLKTQLIKQFFTEAVLYTLLSAVVAVLLVALLLAPFNELAGKEISITQLFVGYNLALLAALVFGTALLAGSYPSFFLTSFRPAEVLKGKLSKISFGNLFLRNGLVVFQFTISTALIVCSIIMYQQLQFTRNKNMGMEKENVIVFANANRLGVNQDVFRKELAATPGVRAASISSSVPTKYLFGDGYTPVQKDGVGEDVSLTSFIVDNNFVPALKLVMLKGRNFSPSFNDSASVILNESAAKQLGWKDPVGQHIKYPGGNDVQFEVIGMVKDFNVQSLHNEIAPFALFHQSSKTYDIGISYVSASVEAGKIDEVLSKAETKWKAFAPATPFEYSFLDEEFEALYRADRRVGAVFGLFTGLSIFVACLGLFGLATYTAERRTKEIGIRKVLGASVHGVVGLLSKEFIKPVFVAALIAIPVAWWMMSKWLEDFVYRINIDWFVFFIALAGVILIAMITVSFKAIGAAVANPVKSLRTE